MTAHSLRQVTSPARATQPTCSSAAGGSGERGFVTVMADIVIIATTNDRPRRPNPSARVRRPACRNAITTAPRSTVVDGICRRATDPVTDQSRPGQQALTVRIEWIPGGCRRRFVVLVSVVVGHRAQALYSSEPGTAVSKLFFICIHTQMVNSHITAGTDDDRRSFCHRMGLLAERGKPPRITPTTTS